jgi:palmitoyltransferase
MDAHSLSFPSQNMSRRWARKIERYCCTCATYFPLAFVYGLTSWAVWVVVNVSTTKSSVPWIGECDITLSYVPPIPAVPVTAKD